MYKLPILQIEKQTKHHYPRKGFSDTIVNICTLFSTLGFIVVFEFFFLSKHQVYGQVQLIMLAEMLSFMTGFISCLVFKLLQTSLISE